ncbi:MAG: PrsW family intramembrane metalloprotease [Bacilli bacterium]|nr:PrsW family intramembrane metalloprotease [Bacilli bacterium]
MDNIFSTLDPSKVFIILVLTTLPSILLFSLILYSDRKSKEPLLMILICIFSGAFTICLSLIVDKLLIRNNFIIGGAITHSDTYLVFRTFILAAVEEYSKLLVIYLFIFKNKNYDDIFDGFVYSSITALSFSLVETVMYVFSEKTYGDMSSLAVLRNFTSIPLHVVCGIAMGYFLSLSKFSKVKSKKIINMVLALFIPIFIHTIYNVFFSKINVSEGNMSAIVVILLFVLSIYSVGIVFIMKTNILNKIFINNGVYSKKKAYLMTKNEFILRESRRYT